MTLDEKLRRAAQGVADRVEAPYVDIAGVRAGARARTRRTQAVGVAAVVLVIALTGVALGVGRDAKTLEPVEPPAVQAGGPVWYDSDGLHHGDVTVEPAVDLLGGEDRSALALVRTGAIYLDPISGDVWFHPWDGDPRVVGRDSQAGPGGDPTGDVAAWFEGSELVVYDTAQGRELSRTTGLAPVAAWAGREHSVGGNGFMHVSAEEVVWHSDNGVHRIDLTIGATSGAPLADRVSSVVDVHDDTVLWGEGHSDLGGVLRAGTLQGRGASFDGLEPIGRLSPDGSTVLSVYYRGEVHAAAVADVRTREVTRLPVAAPRSIAWAYGDVAMVYIDDAGDSELFACDVSSATCDRLVHGSSVVLPTS